MKMFTKILSVLLAVMMLVCLVACDKSAGGGETKEETIAGKWEGTLSDKAIEAVLGEMEMDLDTKVTFFFEFAEDGNGKITIDEADMKALAEEFALQLLETMAEEFELSVDDLLAGMEMTKEEYIAATTEGMDEESLESKFTYTVDGDKLTIVEEEAESVITFGLADGKLEMKDVDEDEASEAIIEAMFPMTLTRVE